MAVTAAQGVGQALQRRCGRTQNDRNIGQLCSFYRDIPGVIPKPLALLVGKVVLLIHHNHTGPGKRGKYR